MEAKKTPKADLENRRGLYLEIGLVVIMAVALVAFEWKNYDQEQIEVVQRTAIDEVEDVIIQTQQEELPPPPPPEQPETSPESRQDEPGSTPAVPFNRPGETGSDASTPDRQPFSPVLRTVLTGFAVLAGLTALVFGRYLILRKLLQARLSDPDGKKRAVNFYRQAERVLRYGGEVPQELQTVAEKARFSQHEISEEELQQCSQQLSTLTQNVADGLSRWKKLLFRYASGNL